MPLNRFRLGVIIRVIVLTLTLAAIAWLLVATEYVMTIVLLSAIVFWQITALIRYVERVERDLTRFLIAVRYEDFFETFRGTTTKTASRLNDEFTRIMSEFRRVRTEREEQVQYLQTVLQHIASAVISYDSAGEIELANSAARKLFKVNRLNHIDRLQSNSGELVRVLKTIRAGQQRVVKVVDEGEVLQLLVRATEFVRGGRRLTLVAIQNIRSELEEQELEAWQNLIRVLTHEIRNSITPIASLATSTNALLTDLPLPAEEAREDMEDAQLAVRTIHKRSQGLLRFVEVFRSLYKLPEADLQTMEVQPVLDHLGTFFGLKFEEAGVQLQFKCEPEGLSVLADCDLIEQVLINLLTNALQAVKGRPNGQVVVRASIDKRGRGRISVRDNGPGIPSDVIDRVFIPFFTTKPEGTGVGLSLSRQIMKLHRGTITVQSEADKGAVFTIVF
jgi:nitrogen fixation/metabolism regulation signal transduction histidine kinase